MLAVLDATFVLKHRSARGPCGVTLTISSPAPVAIAKAAILFLSSKNNCGANRYQPWQLCNGQRLQAFMAPTWAVASLSNVPIAAPLVDMIDSPLFGSLKQVPIGLAPCWWAGVKGSPAAKAGVCAIMPPPREAAGVEATMLWARVVRRVVRGALSS